MSPRYFEANPTGPSEADKRTARIASVQKLERSRSKPSSALSLQRKGYIKSSGKPIRKKNDAKQARKAVNYRKGLAAYRKSETYKQVEARAANRCEHTETRWEAYGLDNGGLVEERCFVVRGGERGNKLHHHHKTYARFGGKELPEDMALLCDQHHAAAEALARPWNRSRKFSKGLAKGER